MRMCSINERFMRKVTCMQHKFRVPLQLVPVITWFARELIRSQNEDAMSKPIEPLDATAMNGKNP